MATQFMPSVPTKRLAAAILSTDMTFSLNNYLSWKGNIDGTTVMVAADFPTTGRGCFRNTSNTQIEFFTFDPTTIAGPITILTRGNDYRGGTADGAATAAKYTWPANSTLVELGTTAPAAMEDYVDKISDETIAGIKTFSSSPIAPTPTTATQVAIKSYVDGVAIAGGADSSTTVKGISKMSVAPASATNPIAVGDNDSRVPTANQTLALAGNNTSIAVGSGNKVVTQTGLQNGAETYATTTGSANAYVLTLSPVPAALVAGQKFTCKANFANTGAATLNVNGLGAIAIKKLDGATALLSGDIASGQIVEVEYDGTNFQMISPIAQIPTGSFVGTPVSNSSSTTQNIDSAFVTTFLPRTITLYYNLAGKDGAGAASTQAGIASFNGTTFTASFVSNTAGSTSPSAGVAGGISVSLSITSVTATGFTIRAAYVFGGTFTPASASFYPVAIA